MRLARVGAALSIALAAAASAQAVRIGLPIDDDPDSPGLVVVWPKDNCVECGGTPQSRSAYQRARDAIFGDDSATLTGLHPRIVRVIRYTETAGGSYDSADVTLAEISRRLKGYSITAESMLGPHPKSDLNTYGIMARRPNTEIPSFMSLSFKGKTLETVFLMPDRPYFVWPPVDKGK